ncbi:hypothetical protein [Microbispora sp. KK1-11]|uniref:hypothetical protein n=1 Tax=Microbispora sp. KK1-11 TaxID=2053005 RepID=UPI001158E6FC|nr:hypothetical protein [Microbispora sp. KK1-11]TQS25159.1 hypothetical protein FLW16_32050 [Microbispora sp. KK1-11]
MPAVMSWPVFGPACVLVATGGAGRRRPGGGRGGARFHPALGTWTWAPALLTVGGVLLLLVPDGRLPGRAWRLRRCR